MNKIPKIIHYCWVGGSPKPESVLYCIESWKKYCPDYEIKEWNESNYDFKKNEYMKQAYEAKKWGFVPDYARLDIIYQYGGIYLDTDVELIKNLDDLLKNKGFFGFEDTGEKEYFIACGLGFGAEKNNELIKRLRDYYDNVSFRNADNSLNLLPAPRHNLHVFEEYGVQMNNRIQNIDDNVFYPAEFFCPKIFKTGKMTVTKNTYSIHHFSASWMDDKIRKEINHNQKICNRFGEKWGRKILILESIYEKYGILGGIKKSLIYGYESLLVFYPLILSIIKSKFSSKKNSDKIILFDTALFTKNCGDEIIMENCIFQLNKVFDTKKAIHISTHKKPENNCNIEGNRKIVCGTNILSCNMRKYGLWKLPRDLSKYHDITLMGVGFDSYNMNYDLYTRYLFKHMFTKKGYHSVRDSFSKECLEKMGIHNVLNTGCPTMWKLTPEHCATIPEKKAKNVVCTITDYKQDLVNDKRMIEILTECYDKVYIWIQGKYDYEYLEKLGMNEKLIILDNNLKTFDNVLEKDDLDYIGTRLHAGIRALAYKHRSIIVSIDNRAESIAKDTGLPIIKRENVESCLKEKILGEFKTEIKLPVEDIEKWLNQFSG